MTDFPNHGLNARFFNMYAIIETGGKQLKVSKGDRVDVEKLPLEVGAEVSFDKVLLVGGNGETKVGTPYLTTVKVVGQVLSQDRAPKIVVYKYKRRKGYDKKQGHRQYLTKVEIKEIKI